MNFLRRKQVTIHVIDQIGKNLNNPMIGNPDFILGIFSGVCKLLGAKPSERDARLIFEHVQAEIQHRQWQAAQALISRA